VVEPAIPAVSSQPGESIAMRATILARRTFRLVALLSLGTLSGCGGTSLETAWNQATDLVTVLTWDPQGPLARLWNL
jgi:hypothetical protein